jgi:TonB-dependent SusC/RagA subfamily outer membrane receptor
VLYSNYYKKQYVKITLKMKKLIILMFAVSLVFSCTNKPSSSGNSDYSKDEIVDDGFSRKDGRNSSSSAKTIETDDENATLENYLRQMPGLSVTGSGYNATVTVRGVKSIQGFSEALFVVDGVPISGGLGEVQGLVQVRDIDRMTVLKDGSATALYGARGGSGVIVIRTKK